MPLQVNHLLMALVFRSAMGLQEAASKICFGVDITKDQKGIKRLFLFRKHFDKQDNYKKTTADISQPLSPGVGHFVSFFMFPTFLTTLVELYCKDGFGTCRV